MLKNNKNKLKTKPKRLLEPSQILFCSILKIGERLEGLEDKVGGKVGKVGKNNSF